MKPKDFFRNLQIRKKFDGQTIRRVKGFMARNGLLPNFGEMTPESAAAFIILASCTATRKDLQTFGMQLLDASTNEDTPEKIHEVLSLSLSDPLRSATFQKIVFDRMAAKVILEFIDGEQIPINLGVPISADWKQPGGIVWKQYELVIIAQDLKEEIVKGEILNSNTSTDP